MKYNFMKMDNGFLQWRQVETRGERVYMRFKKRDRFFRNPILS